MDIAPQERRRAAYLPVFVKHAHKGQESPCISSMLGHNQLVPAPTLCGVSLPQGI